MNRRAFLRRASLVAVGAVAVEQLGLLDRLGWKRRLFSGFGLGAPTLYGDGIRDDTVSLQALVDGRQVYSARLGRLIGGTALVTLPAGCHRMSRTLEFRRSDTTIDFGGSRVEFTRPIDAYLHVHGGVEDLTITNGHFSGPHARVGVLCDSPFPDPFPDGHVYQWVTE